MAPRGLSRIAIVNRGDPAVRFIRAVRDHNLERGTDLRTVALYTDEDATSSFVLAADEAVLLGPAMVTSSGGRRVHSYVDLDRLRIALVEANVDSAWVGWGFVSEQADFVELCESLGISFIGPSAESIRLLGSKVGAKQLAESLGVAVAPWGGPVSSARDALVLAERIGYPLLVKASAGGGGRGIRAVMDASELEPAMLSAAAEAGAAFGDRSVFLEKLVTRARHLEVQVAADGDGNAWAVGVRDCSVQRRKQKVIEESIGSRLDPVMRERLQGDALRLIRAAKYNGVGTVEFLLDLDDQVPYFMEVNTRLQVEHTVSEATTGIDLVKLQLDLASGVPLRGQPPAEIGVAIEARITAEDPFDDFRPAPGRLVVFRPPAGPGIRVDTGFTEGEAVSAHFDPLIMKVIASGADRREAISRLHRAVGEAQVVVAGGSSTLGFASAILAREELLAAEVDVGWLDGLVASGESIVEDRSDLALVLAAVELAVLDREANKAHLFSTATRGRADLGDAAAHEIELVHRGMVYNFTVFRLGETSFRVATPDGVVTIDHQVLGDRERAGSCGRDRYRASVVASPAEIQVDLDGSTYLCRSERAGVVRAPSSAVVVQVRVSAGDKVEAGDVLLVLESMKLESAITAALTGVVSEVLVSAGALVDAGTALIDIDIESSSAPSAAGTRAVRFSALTDGSRGHHAGDDAYDEAMRLLSGFHSGHLEGPLRPTALPEHDDRERSMLRLFADCCGVTSPARPSGDRAGTAMPSGGHTLYQFLMSPERSRSQLPPDSTAELARVLASYGADDLEPGPVLDEALYRLVCAGSALAQVEPLVSAILHRALERAMGEGSNSAPELPPLDLLEHLHQVTSGRFPSVSNTAQALVQVLYLNPAIAGSFQAARRRLDHRIEELKRHAAGPARSSSIAEIVDSPLDLGPALWSADLDAHTILQVELQRTYPWRSLVDVTSMTIEGTPVVTARRQADGGASELIVAMSGRTIRAVDVLHAIRRRDSAAVLIAELFLGPLEEAMDLSMGPALVTVPGVRRATLNQFDEKGSQRSSISWFGSGVEPGVVGVHPATAERLEFWRLQHFALTHLASDGACHLLSGVADSNPDDRRLFVLGHLSRVGVGASGDESTEMGALEDAMLRSFRLLRMHHALTAATDLPSHNRVILYVDGAWRVSNEALRELVRRIEPATRNLHVEQIIIQATMPDGDTGEMRREVIHISAPSATGMAMGVSLPSEHPVRPLSRRRQRMARLRRRGLRDPYDLVTLLVATKATYADFPLGNFTELDLDLGGRLVPVDRERGQNETGIVVGLIENFTEKHPEGMRRIALLSDPGEALGALGHGESRRIIAALDLAQRERLPVEWFAVSSGARIAMDTGTENLDAVAGVLRRIITFTQAGGEINVIVAGVNVGAQSYFNAEATMLMHTRGILVMTPQGSMVLTGKEALDFAGGISAEDNLGIGGYDRVMGPNGQAQYWAPTLEAACEVLFRYYEHSYVHPDETAPRTRSSVDPDDRDVTLAPHPAVPWSEFRSVGEIFSSEHNPERKKPFEMRALMDAVVDSDARVLERWSDMVGAEGAIVWDAHLGGHPVCLIAVESHPIARSGVLPADGPEAWSAATLFPRSSKKIARAINSASGNRPVVVLANLAGFDGSPESMRKLQLEYGAEIGRAVTNFEGPIVFCVVSRYHGGAFVVFSKALNDRLEVLALEGAKASVIGGSAAAAVVFSRDVEARTSADERLVAMAEEWRLADEGRRPGIEIERASLTEQVRAEVRAQLARDFDAVHSVERAREVGSVDDIIEPAQLRPRLISAVRRGRM